MLSLQDSITLLEREFNVKDHLTVEAQGDLQNRAETEDAYRRHIPKVKEYGPNIKTFGAHQKIMSRRSS